MNQNKGESKLKTYSLDEVIDEHIGKKGTNKRDLFELELEIYSIGEMIKEVRKSKKLSQEELGNLIGVKKAQISRIESGSSNLTIHTMMKVFKALNTKVKLQIDAGNKRLAI